MNLVAHLPPSTSSDSPSSWYPSIQTLKSPAGQRSHLWSALCALQAPDPTHHSGPLSPAQTPRRKHPSRTRRHSQCLRLGAAHLHGVTRTARSAGAGPHRPGGEYI